MRCIDGRARHGQSLVRAARAKRGRAVGAPGPPDGTPSRGMSRGRSMPGGTPLPHEAMATLWLHPMG
eukprot:366014-Chlamydomonas_euryale.AAC.7